MKNLVFAIDGRQLDGNAHGGVQRFLYEILRELDKIAAPGEYELILPENAAYQETYQNIRIVRTGKLSGLLWEQISLPLYLLQHHRYGIYPCSVVPYLYCPGIAVLHDIMFKTVPMVADSMKNPFLRFLLVWNYRTAARYATLVGTVSEYSRQDIIKTYRIREEKVFLIGNGWNHITRIQPDDSWMQQHPEIVSGNYYFSLSANRVQKNFRWIYETARKNPDTLFVMAGTQEEWQKKMEYDAPNMIHLGFITDGQIRSLMMHCKAFLFPSLYEGFGIPPMEALACGAKIVIANASCLPEIYQKSACYIDPYDYNVNLDAVLQQKTAPAEQVLRRYTWNIAAKRLDAACKKIRKAAAR